MDRNRIVAGLDVHKDSVYLCIMRYGGNHPKQAGFYGIKKSRGGYSRDFL